MCGFAFLLWHYFACILDSLIWIGNLSTEQLLQQGAGSMYRQCSDLNCTFFPLVHVQRPKFPNQKGNYDLTVQLYPAGVSFISCFSSIYSFSANRWMCTIAVVVYKIVFQIVCASECWFYEFTVLCNYLNTSAVFI